MTYIHFQYQSFVAWAYKEKRWHELGQQWALSCSDEAVEGKGQHTAQCLPQTTTLETETHRTFFTSNTQSFDIYMCLTCFSALIDWSINQIKSINQSINQSSAFLECHLQIIQIIVMDAVSEYVQHDVLWDMLYADDLIIADISSAKLQERFGEWQEALERKGLKVNADKTETMVCARTAESL